MSNNRVDKGKDLINRRALNDALKAFEQQRSSQMRKNPEAVDAEHYQLAVNFQNYIKTGFENRDLNALTPTHTIL